MFKGAINEKDFVQNMQNLKRFCKSYDKMLFELTKYQEKDAKKIRNRIKKEGIAGLIVNSYVDYKRSNANTLVGVTERFEVENKTPRYFSKHRLAIYTVVFGSYDTVKEPVFIPDNCDYYIVTDQIVPEDSIWKKIDISKFDLILKRFTNKEKNCFFKLHPDLLFKDYEYSIYLDGNIMPVTDLTEYVNYLGDCGIGMFRHPSRQCIYDECKACMYFGMISSEQGEKHIQYLETNHMPSDYGLLEACIIARKHHSDICKKVMGGFAFC